MKLPTPRWLATSVRNKLLAMALLPLLGVLPLLGAGLLWGLVFIGPLLLPDYPAALQSFGRYLAFGLIALPLAALDRRGLAQLTRADWREALRLALVGNIVYYLFLSASIQWAGGPLPTMIIGTLPVVIAITSNLRDAARDGKLPWLKLAPSLGLIAAGTVVLSAGGSLRFGSAGLLAHITFHQPADSYFPGPDEWGTQALALRTSSISQPPLHATMVRWMLERAQDRGGAEAAGRAGDQRRLALQSHRRSPASRPRVATVTRRSPRGASRVPASAPRARRSRGSPLRAVSSPWRRASGRGCRDRRRAPG